MRRRDFIANSTIAGVASALAAAKTAAADAPAKPVRVGVIGVGKRGRKLIGSLLAIPGVEVPAVADMDTAAIAATEELCLGAGKARPEAYTRGPEDFRRMVDRKDLDAIISATPWEWHARNMLAALDSGKYGGVEVPAAITVDECWSLVEKSEKTGIPCMMLENACFQRESMAVQNLIAAGLLGEIFHCESGYNHDIRFLFWNKAKEELTWRGRHFASRDGNLYPTHQLGPIALIMDVNRGARMQYMVSMSSPQFSITNYAREMYGADHPFVKQHFRQGDVNCSLIKLNDGRMITQYFDTQSWRPRDDIFRYHGTKGVVAVTQMKIFSIDRHWDRKQTEGWAWADLQPFLKEFDHPLWKKYADSASTHGHGGSDWMALIGFVEAVRARRQTPLDVYDAAAWSVIFPLSEESVRKGSHPVEIPDFTRGNWQTCRKWRFDADWRHV